MNWLEALGIICAVVAPMTMLTAWIATALLVGIGLGVLIGRQYGWDKHERRAYDAGYKWGYDCAQYDHRAKRDAKGRFTK